MHTETLGATPREPQGTHQAGRGSLLTLVLLWATLLGSLSGCAGFMDDISSRDYQWGSMFAKPSPLEVLLKSEDGNKRALALASLREPLQTNPQARQEQDMFVTILTTAATRDRHPLCRLAAIQALGTFKDPRAAQALDRAFLETNEFGPEINNVVRQEALVALGKTGGSIARDRLVLVVREPPPAADSSEQEKREAMDRRLTAIRALGKFNNYEVAQTLVKVLEKEKDVALRDRAHESLVAMTGKKLPPDPKAWEDLLHQPAGPDGGVPRQPSNPLTVLASWFQE